MNTENPFGDDPWEIRVDRPIIDREVAAVRISIVHPSGSGRLEAVGSSKCHPADTWTPAIGRGYALARALRSLADQLEASTDILVRHNCHRITEVDTLRPTQAEIVEFWEDIRS